MQVQVTVMIQGMVDRKEGGGGKGEMGRGQWGWGDGMGKRGGIEVLVLEWGGGDGEG